MTWWGASAWASQLTFAGYADWRLPSALGADGSAPCSNCSTSELGGVWFEALENSSSPNTGDFEGLQLYSYWSSTEFSPAAPTAWRLSTSGNFLGVAGKGIVFYATAVSDGDLQAAQVPEPASPFLVLLALGLVAQRRTKWRHKR